MELKKQNHNQVGGILFQERKESSIKKKLKFLEEAVSKIGRVQSIQFPEKPQFQGIRNIQEVHREKDHYKSRKNKKLTTMCEPECPCHSFQQKVGQSMK